MGMNTDIHVFDITKMKEVFTNAVGVVKEGQLKPAELLDKVMPKVGIVLDNHFILQNEERWDEYSPWSSFLHMFEQYYQRTDFYELSDEAQIAWRYEGASAYEVFDEIGIDPDELPAHPDDEEDEDE